MAHPLDGIWEKTRRAEEHINNLNDEITTFLNSNVYSTTSEPNADAREHILRIIGPEPPLRFSVIAGEIIHQCRSALDHLIGQLVRANGGEPDHRHEFPICNHPDKFKEACSRGKIKGISTTTANILESIQPYHNPKGFEWHPLWVLHSMDVTDKHRLLMVILATADVTNIRLHTGDAEKTPEIVAISKKMMRARPTKDGAEIMRVKLRNPHTEMKLDAKPIVEIALEQYGPIPKQAVIPCLTELKGVTVGTVLRFVGELRRMKTLVLLWVSLHFSAFSTVMGQLGYKLT